MLNLFVSISSVSYQLLVLKSPFIQVIFMPKIPYLKAYNLKGLELFSKANFEYSWVSEGQYLIEYVFCANLLVWFFVPPPLNTYFCEFLKEHERNLILNIHHVHFVTASF